MVHTKFGIALLLSLLSVGSTGCTGGCFEEADPVRVSPAASCLHLDVGTICGAPELKGPNNCPDALVLPPTSAGGEPVRVEPGASALYTMSSSSPGIRIIKGNPNTDWVISAMLGDQNIAITVTIHDN